MPPPAITRAALSGQDFSAAAVCRFAALVSRTERVTVNHHHAVRVCAAAIDVGSVRRHPVTVSVTVDPLRRETSAGKPADRRGRENPGPDRAARCDRRGGIRHHSIPGLTFPHPVRSWSRSRCMVIVSDQDWSRGRTTPDLPRMLDPTIPMGRCQLVVHHTLVGPASGVCSPVRSARDNSSVHPPGSQDSSRRLMATYRRYHRTMIALHGLVM